MPMTSAICSWLRTARARSACSPSIYQQLLGTDLNGPAPFVRQCLHHLVKRRAHVLFLIM